MEKIIAIDVKHLKDSEKGVEGRITPILEKGFRLIRSELIESTYIIFLEK